MLNAKDGCLPLSTVRGRYYQIQADYTDTKTRLFVQSRRDKKKTIELVVLGYKWTIYQKHIINHLPKNSQWTGWEHLET